MADMELGIDARTFNAGMAQVNSKLDKLASKSKKATNKVESNFSKLKKSVFSLKGALISLGSAFAIKQLVTSIITIGSEFEKTMKIVQGVSRATQEEFKAMNEIAKELGETTEFTATQAAEGLRFLTMAGISAKEAIAALPGVLDLATAGNLQLGEAADIASNAMTAMGLQASDLGRINDSLIATTTRSNSTVRTLAEAFKYVAPTAKALGYDIEQVNALLGKLHDAGIQSSMAGTQLNQALLRSSKIMSKLGMEGNVIDLLKRINKEQWSVNKVMKEFAGRGGRAILVLKDMVGASGDTIGTIQELEKAIRGASGEAESLANKMRDTTIGAFQELKSAIEGVALESFERNSDKVKDGVKELTEVIRDNKESYIEAGEQVLILSTNLGTFLARSLKTITPLLGDFNKALEDSGSIIDKIVGKMMGFNSKEIEKLKIDPIDAASSKTIRDYSNEITKLYDELRSIEKFQETFSFAPKISGFLTNDKEKNIQQQIIELEKKRNNLVIKRREHLKVVSEGYLSLNDKLLKQDINRFERVDRQNKENLQRQKDILEIAKKTKDEEITAIENKVFFDRGLLSMKKEINSLNRDSLGLMTAEEKQIKNINSEYDKKVKNNKKNKEIVKFLNDERKKSITLIKKHNDSLLDSKQIYDADVKSLKAMTKHQEKLEKLKVEGNKEYLKGLKKTNDEIDKIAKNIGDSFTNGLKAGIEGGLEGALDYIKGSFINVLGGLISNTVSDTIGDSIATSLVSSGVGDKLSESIGTIGGGVAGAGVGALAGLVTSSLAEKKAEREASRQYVNAMNSLRESIEDNIIALERQTAADFKSHDWSEKMWTAQRDMISKLDETGERPGDEISGFGNVSEELKNERQAWREARSTIREEYTAIMKSLRVDIVRDSQELWGEISDQYLTSFQVAQNDFSDTWGNIVSGYMDSLELPFEGPIAESERFKNLVGDISDPIQQFNLFMEDFQNTLEETPWNTPEWMSEALGMIEIVAGAQLDFERKRVIAINESIKKGEEYTESINKSTTQLNNAIEETQDYFYDIAKTIRDQGGTYEDLMENTRNMQLAFRNLSSEMREDANEIKDIAVVEYLRELRGEVTPLERALDSMNGQFNSWEEEIKQLTNEEDSLSLKRAEADTEIRKLYDAEGNLIQTTGEASNSIDGLTDGVDDLSKGTLEALTSLNSMAERMKTLKEETFDKLFEDLEFKESGLSRENWVQKEIDRLFSLPELTEEEFSKAMGYVEEWYGFATDATQEQLEVIDAWGGVADKIKDLSNSIVSAQRDIRSSELNVAIPIKKLEDITPDYNELLKAAEGGDENALNEYLSFASQYLQIAQDTFKSSEQYQSIYEQVMEDMSDLNSFIQSDDYSEKIYEETRTTNEELNELDNTAKLSNQKLTQVRTDLQKLSGQADNLKVTVNGLVNVHLSSSAVDFNPTPVIMERVMPSKEEIQLGDMDLSEMLALQSKIPSFGDGGVVSQPTFAHIGEAGMEAVIPMKDGAVPVRISGGNNNNNNRPMNVYVEVGGQEFKAIIRETSDEVRVKANKRNIRDRRIYQ